MQLLRRIAPFLVPAAIAAALAAADLKEAEPSLSQAYRSSMFTFAPSPFDREIKAFLADWPLEPGAERRVIHLARDRSLSQEEYHISAGETVQIRASSSIGAAWALGHLVRLLEAGKTHFAVHEAPKNGFRCVLIDVARRYHSLSTLRQIVRWCHAGRVRFLQLHLTDDQNWMLPTNVLAGVDRNNAHKKPAYTRKELRDLQAFAMARGVAIVPEIDIPGHSSLLVRFDPDTFRIKGSPSAGCVNFGSKTVRQKLKALLEEAADLFVESPYVHIGGDEAWYPEAEKDPEFASAMKALAPAATPQDVFVDFVAEMAETVLAKGKTPILWEGFPPTSFAKKRIPKAAAIVAWEGDYYPAKDLAADGFRVINAGWDPFYVVNHFPYDAFTLVPLPNLLGLEVGVFGRVNWSDPTHHRTEFPPDSQILGGLMCWWEGHEWNAHTTLPLRILALGAGLWDSSKIPSYPVFLEESRQVLDSIRRRALPFEVKVEGSRPTNPLQFEERASVRPTSKDPTLTFAIRSDGQPPSRDDRREALTVEKSAVVAIQAFRGELAVGETEFLRLQKVDVIPNLAYRAKVTASTPEDPRFSASLVTDGVANDEASFWLGYPIPCSLTVDLEVQRTFNRIDVVPFWASRQPIQYVVETSVDGASWQQAVDGSKIDQPPSAAGNVHRLQPVTARYVRLRITGTRQFPPTMARIQEIRIFEEADR